MKSLVLAAVLCALAPAVFAHSPLIATTPKKGAVLSQAPAEVTFRFNGTIRLTRVRWTREGGATGDFDLSGYGDFAASFALPFAGDGAGEYLIEWRGLGDDGHPQNGIFYFTID